MAGSRCAGRRGPPAPGGLPGGTVADILAGMPTKKQRPQNDQEEVDWTAVIARCLAYLCLKQSEHTDANKLTQAKFLSSLGLPNKDSAEVIGSSAASLRVLAGRAKKKGGKRNGKSKRA